ncbi:MAG: hypothetical protein M3R27_14210 [Bacteroidota bacterium]|nr:hypothetical protein [Bacteroidota bacterium]
MKTHDNFKYLPIKEKVEILEDEGKFICEITAYGLKVSLYGLNGVFVEVFRAPGTQLLVAVRILEDKKRFRLYTKHIDLKDLLNQSITCFLLVYSICSN